MNSPFPGMDPYTESRHLWKGLHTQLIGELSTHSLPPLLAPAYYVDAERSLQVLLDDEVYPDVEITAPTVAQAIRPSGVGLPVAEMTTEVTERPEIEGEEDQESAIFIRQAHTERLVAVIEILSYSNKTTGEEKRAQYLSKRRALLRSGVHLVEIDLLRWGQRVVTDLPPHPYHILVSRANDRPRTRVWSFGIEDRIPDAPLPLIAPDEHVPIPLQTAYAEIYRARNFHERLDYAQDPEGPLTAAQRRQIRERLTAEGLSALS